MIPVLFEDNDILAVNKPEGLASIPERAKGKGSLVSLLSPQFRDRLYIVHRIDKEASGVILFAKNAAAHRFLNEQFSTRAVRKTYLILVHGNMDERDGVIDKPLRQFGSGRIGIDPKRGKPSETVFCVVERFHSYAIVEAHPVTGRRHQIRVHFYSIGHPVVGDLLYGDKAVQERYPRLMLHARRLEFRLPSGEESNIEAPVPESFTSMIRILREGSEGALPISRCRLAGDPSPF
jgi:tRNA pseudouridine32 synthase / 23S rRNA pseudouridine746 synthase